MPRNNRSLNGFTERAIILVMSDAMAKILTCVIGMMVFASTALAGDGYVAPKADENYAKAILVAVAAVVLIAAAAFKNAKRLYPD